MENARPLEASTASNGCNVAPTEPDALVFDVAAGPRRAKRQRKDGRIEIKVELPPSADGRRNRASVYARTKKEAKHKAEELRREAGLGVDVRSGKQTLEVALEHWLESVVRPTRKNGTYEDYAGSLRRHVVPKLGHVSLRSIQPQMAQSFFSDLLRETGNSGLVRRVHRSLRAALNYFVKVGLIAINPVRNVQLAQADTHGPVVLNAEQTTKLLKAAADDYPWAAVLVVAATTGLRQGELRGLCWPDIDLEAGTIRLARQLARVVDSDGIVGDGEGVTTRHWEFVALKTHASADQIVLPVSCVEALKEHRERQTEWERQSGISTEWTEQSLVFTSASGLPLHQSSFAKALARHLVSAGLPRIRFHDLRHGYGSLLGDQNEPLSEIRDALRHGSIQTTMRYVHPTRAKEERASRVDQALFGARINPASADGAGEMEATITGNGRQMVVTEPAQGPMIF